MPDSLSYEDLRRTRQIFPDPPNKIYPWDYSYWLGDAVSEAKEKSDLEFQARHRRLKWGAAPPIDRSRVYETMSRKQPYVTYTDVELKPGPESDDGWPYQSYYYLMDFGMGQVALPPGTTLVPGQMVRIGGKTYRIKGRQQVTVPKPRPEVLQRRFPDPGYTYVSLEGLYK